MPQEDIATYLCMPHRIVGQILSHQGINLRVAQLCRWLLKVRTHGVDKSTGDPPSRVSRTSLKVPLHQAAVQFTSYHIRPKQEDHHDERMDMLRMKAEVEIDHAIHDIQLRTSPSMHVSTGSFRANPSVEHHGPLTVCMHAAEASRNLVLETDPQTSSLLH